jgi:hypothetical protein
VPGHVGRSQFAPTSPATSSTRQIIRLDQDPDELLGKININQSTIRETGYGVYMSHVPDEVRLAAELLPLFKDTDWEWDWDHARGNYDPTATLCAVEITVKGATGSSPTHILLYHKGKYIGPATPEARGFVSLRLEDCTDDTVAVQYKVPGETHAGSFRSLHNVEYRWQGGKVVQFGDPPADP